MHVRVTLKKKHIFCDVEEHKPPTKESIAGRPSASVCCSSGGFCVLASADPDDLRKLSREAAKAADMLDREIELYEACRDNYEVKAT